MDKVKEFLKNDNSFLIAPHKTDNIFSLAFWRSADENGTPHSMMGATGNQREAYETGVMIGWDLAKRDSEENGRRPNPVGLTESEYRNFMMLLDAFGYQFEYMMSPPAFLRNINNNGMHGFCPGLNICKNYDAIDSGFVISDSTKEKIYNLIKTEIQH